MKTLAELAQSSAFIFLSPHLKVCKMGGILLFYIIISSCFSGKTTHFLLAVNPFQSPFITSDYMNTCIELFSVRKHKEFEKSHAKNPSSLCLEIKAEIKKCQTSDAVCNLDLVSVCVSFGESPASQGCLLFCVASLAQTPEGCAEVTLLSL